MNADITFGRKLASLEFPSVILTETWHASGLRLQPHTHANANVNFVLAGRFVEVVDGQRFNCAAGSVIVKPEGAAHSNDYLGIPTRCLVLEFPNSEKWTKILSNPWGSQDAELMRLGWQIYHEFSCNDAVRKLAIEELVFEFLDYGNREWHRREIYHAAPKWLKSVCELIDCSHSEISVEDLAREASVHPRHVMRSFRRFTGCSIGERLRQNRVRRAQVLLAQDDLTIAAVAVEVGFYDHSHFVRTFKQLTGLTPTQYRNLCH